MEVSEGTRQFVLFRLGQEEYGLPIEQVNSIIRFEEATPVPKAPPMVDGVINLRGRVVPVVNLARKFGSKTFDPTAMSRIVIVEAEGGLVGLTVDAANEVVTIAPEDIREAPDTALSSDTEEAFEGVASIQDMLVILLRLDRVLPKSDYTTSAPGEGESDV